MPKFFVSYVYEDRAYKAQLADWYRSGMLERWEPVYETEDMRPGGRRAVQQYLSPLIRQCQAIIVLVGDDSHNHDAIAYEVQNARSAGIQVVPVRLFGTRGAPPPSVPAPNVDFAPADILAALKALEGGGAA